MTRFIQQGSEAPKKAPKESKEERPVKAGNKGYDYSNLYGGKKIPTKGGWK